MLFRSKVIPHAAIGIGIFQAASLHAAAALPNCPMHEYQHSVFDRNLQHLHTRMRCEAGAFTLPDGPGLGVEPAFGGAKSIDADASPWAEWRSGYQLMIDTIRKAGAHQPILLDGLSGSHVWRRNTDANIPRDPLNMLAYDIHPFPSDGSRTRKSGKARLDYYREVYAGKPGWQGL